MSLARALALLLLALAVSFVLATTGHGDLFISAYNSSLVVTDHPNIYHAVADEPTAVFPNGLSGAPYGPLFYYPTALWLFVLDRLHLVDLGSWRGPDDPAHSLTAIVLLKLPNLAAWPRRWCWRRRCAGSAAKRLLHSGWPTRLCSCSH